jgi:hypothetical protein
MKEYRLRKVLEEEQDVSGDDEDDDEVRHLRRRGAGWLRRPWLRM